MDGGENHHRIVVVHSVLFASEFTGVYVGDFLIHVEEVAVALTHHVDSETVDSLREVEEDGKAGVVDTESCVATLLGGTRSHVAGHEVAESGIATFEIVIAVFFRDVASFDLSFLELHCVLKLFGDPDTAVVAERLRHKGKLRLLVAMHGDTRGVDLYVGGICEISALAIAGHCGRAVASHGVGGKEVGVAIAAGGDDHGVSSEAFELTRHEVFGDDAAGTLHAVLVLDENHVVHLITVEAFHLSELNLAVERRVSTEKELLSRLALGVERTANLSATERTVGEQTAVFASERHTLSHTLVDDIVRHLGKTVDVGFACAIVAALDGVIEKTIY